MDKHCYIEEPDVIFRCVEVIIEVVRLQICTRVVPNDRRVDRGGSLGCIKSRMIGSLGCIVE